MTNKAYKMYYFIFLAVIIVGGMFFILYKGLSFNPYSTSVKIVNKPIPSVKQTDLFRWNNLIDVKSFNTQSKGRWYLINVWASWCEQCLNEQPLLMDLARQGITIYGINYSDKATSAKKWLKKYGNPYKQIIWDAREIIASNLGVSTVPSTLLVDPKGIIRCQVVGNLTPQIWQNKLIPFIEQHDKASAEKK